MAYHNLYDSWSWLGGHADGEGNLLDVLDAAAFFFEASNDPAMDIPGIATVALKPSLYLNGSPVPGVDLEKAMNRFMDIYSLAEMIG